MEIIKGNQDQFLEGLHRLTGIKKSVLSDYAKENDILHIIDHPAVIKISDKEYEKIVQLKDFINLYQYFRENEKEDIEVMDSITKASAYCSSQLSFYREREAMLCIFLGSGMRVLSCEKISQGTVDIAYVHPREVVKRALQLDAVGIILAHNHPGGSCRPSQCDIRLTNTFHNILRPFEMHVYDHIIVGDDKAFSMKNEGISFTDFAYVKGEEYEKIPIGQAAERGVDQLKEELLSEYFKSWQEVNEIEEVEEDDMER
ncbi:DNA repair protein RadC [Kineothrix alysoides]|uniref:DNA repair protein RadC n=1 Tax=Kineothrix alysoides TaxID=1469948 RepID=A0A4R1QUS8_9FIRM|nr:JAB domain-containing protein [Kineothrix alysoides]TCL57678.1 DNA repair protein RadC [Kineothrix alysoides]